LPIDNGGVPIVHEAPLLAAPKNKRFFMSADLNTTRIGRDM
jgi:hypothetical protein